jgi:hypothetical protein
LIADLTARLGVEHHTDQTNSLANLRRLLAAKNCPVHDSVLQFEQEYGGLLVPNAGYPNWLNDGEYKVVGSYACLQRGETARGGPSQASLGLVPIVSTSNDNVYFLDQRGRGWFHDTVADADAVQVTASGDTIMAGLVLYAMLSSVQVQSEAGAHGARLAGHLGVAPIPIASGRLDRWWGSPDLLVSESPCEMEAWHLDPEAAAEAPRKTTVCALSLAGELAIKHHYGTG